MTVICFDGLHLAADKRMTSVGGLHRTVTKIFRHLDELLAITGSLDMAQELRVWYEKGADPDLFPESAREDEASLVVIRPGGFIWIYCSGPIPTAMEEKRAAFGSGRDYAEAAMYLGLTAQKAVELACHFQTDCGNGIDILALHPVSTVH